MKWTEDPRKTWKHQTVEEQIHCLENWVRILTPLSVTLNSKQESEKEEMNTYLDRRHDIEQALSNDPEVQELRGEMALQPYEDEQPADIITMQTGVAAIFMAQSYPLQYKMLDALPPSIDRELMMNVYFGVEPRSISSYFNKEIVINGCIVCEYPAFMSKPVNDQYGQPIPGSSRLTPGYMSLLFWTDTKDENGDFIILKASSVSLASHMFYVMRNPEAELIQDRGKGWYLWRDKNANPTPQTYRFTQAKPGAPYRMINVTRQSETAKK